MDYQCSTHQRIDAPLSDQVYSALKMTPHLTRYLHHKELRYTAIDGHVTLEGTVETFFEKQVAQEALRKIGGVIRINNDLQVSRRRTG